MDIPRREKELSIIGGQSEADGRLETKGMMIKQRVTQIRKRFSKFVTL